ncbi:unnamed protein product [Blepharisma stoltei]|uniref:Uncharacterized protein n=1 Tax=Blepharisma stoltei TaxID=1481888 RepID=A0AAU9K0W4_9CILI|nr:unnamed protein product [Blepharisma stoltei]
MENFNIKIYIRKIFKNVTIGRWFFLPKKYKFSLFFPVKNVLILGGSKRTLYPFFVLPSRDSTTGFFFTPTHMQEDQV